jgi:biofilm PGA synthesis N-glycosyltransferase PgaC
MIGGVVHYFLLEEGRTLGTRAIAASGIPKVSIVVPCFNEAANARSVIRHLDAMDYPNYDVIAVNDGSKDRTGEILNELAVEIPRLLVIHHARNEGKAVGLTTAAAVSNASICCASTATRCSRTTRSAGCSSIS